MEWKITFALCLLASMVFAQSMAKPVAEVDSAAYYDELYTQNYQKFRANESVSDVFFWTSVGLSAAVPISGMLLGAKSMGCNVNEDNDCRWSALDWGLAAPLLLFLPSWIAYGSFSIAKNIRKRKYNEYYRKREDYVKRRLLEKNEMDKQSFSIQLMPLLNPVDNHYGALFALNF